MFVQDAAPIQSARTWRSPTITEHIVLEPKTAQLKFSSRKPKRGRSDREHEAELKCNRQDRRRDRQFDGKKKRKRRINSRTCIVDFDEEARKALLWWGQILPHEIDDPNMVGKAISELLADAVRHEPGIAEKDMDQVIAAVLRRKLGDPK